MSLEAFVLQLLKKAVPESAEQLLEVAAGKSLDAAFAQLDEVEAKELRWTTAAAPPLVLPGVKGHSCLHLLSSIPRHLRAGECQGTCGEETQLGKPCQWPGHVAHNCPMYEPTQVRK